MNKLLIVAIDIRSTHNIGSILRTADGFSAEVLICGITPRPKNLNNEDRLPHVIEKTHATIAKTALGAEKQVSMKYFKTIKETIEYLQKNKYSIVALEQSNKSKSITKLKIKNNTAVLIGPEVTGLSQDILEICSETYEIPMFGSKESFNVSVATGIALYQARLSDMKNMIK